MPIINPDRCYVTIVPKHIANDDSLDFDLVAALIKEQIGLNKKYRLEYHFGEQSTYRGKSNMIASMLTIQSYLKATHYSPAEKIMIIDKLSEGIDACTPGFHDRLNSILLGLVRPQHIDEFLEKIRIGIVDAAARRLSSDVHKHNQMFIGAASMGFGVHPMSSEDVYSVDKLTSSEAESLKKAVDTYYTGTSLIWDLKTQIEGELRTHYGYVGLNNKGYTSGIYLKIIDFLSVLLNKVFDVPALFILNEESVPLDIDWFAFESQLVDFLRSNNYLLFVRKENNFFKTLYTKNEAALYELLDQEAYVKLVLSFDFLAHPERLKHVPIEKKEYILQIVFFNLPMQVPFKTLQKYLRDVDTVCEEKLKMEYKQRVTLAWLSLKENRQEFYTMFNSDEWRIQYKVISLFPYIIDNPYKMDSPYATDPCVLTELFLNFQCSIVDAIHVIPHKEVNLRIPLYQLMIQYSDDRLVEVLKETFLYTRPLFYQLIFDFLSVPTPLLEKISRLPKSSLFELLVLQSNDRTNAIAYSSIHQPSALSFLLEKIPKGKELELLQTKNAWLQDALMCAAENNEESTDLLLHKIKSIPFMEQCEFFSKRPLSQYRKLKYKEVIKKHVVSILSEQLLRLDTLDPFDSAMKKVMIFLDDSESNKKFAIYSAYYQLISQEGDKKSLIKTALSDTSSALYKAFKMNVSCFNLRYSLFGVIPAMQVFKTALNLHEDDIGLSYLQSGLF